MALRLEPALERATLWGLELDTRYRVLAATLELDPGVAPWDLGDDPRVQVLCAPVSTILATLHRHSGDGETLVTFDVDALLDVTATFGGCVLEPPVFGRPEPSPGEWGQTLSLRAGSSAPDGRRHTATFAVADAEARLRVFARFDDVEVRDAKGNELPLPS